MTLNRATFIFGVTVLSWLIISLLIKPGYFDPITPSHSDPFRYVVLSQDIWETNSWLTPRPLMIAYLKLIGVSQSLGVFFFLLSLPAVLLIATALTTAEFLIKRKFTNLSIIIYLLISFGSALFLAIAQYDFGGSIAGILTCIAVIIFKKNDDSSPEKFWFSLVIPSILFWASIETKPTFAVGLLGAICGLILIEKFSRKSLFLLGAALLIVIAVFVKDAALGSQFIHINNSSNVYSVALNPVKNITLLLFYMRAGYPDALLVGLVISLTYLIINKNFATVIFIAFISIGTAVPMALLVNREWDIYGWYTQIILALAFVLSINLMQEDIQKKTLKGQALLATCMALVTLSAAIYSLKSHPTTSWTISNQKYNENVLRSLSSLNLTIGKKYLFANIAGPYHPFKNTEFIKIFDPKIRNFDVLLRASERGWNDMSHDQTNGLYLSTLTLEKYDSFIIFNKSGNIEYQLSSHSLLSRTSQEIEALLMCGTDIKLRQDSASISDTLDCLNKEGQFTATINIVATLAENQKDFSWLHYHFANALKNTGNIEAAKVAITKAIALEESNPVFLDMQRLLSQENFNAF